VPIWEPLRFHAHRSFHYCSDSSRETSALFPEIG